MQIEKRFWGNWNGRDVHLYDLSAGGMRVTVSDCGALLQSLLVKNGRGEIIDAVLGYDTLNEYLHGETFFGTMVGPIADRLAEGCCTLDGKAVQLSLNAGPDCMHSGDRGFHAWLWDAEYLADGITFTRSFADGELGLPGRLQVRLCYRIPTEGVLRLEYSAVCDAETALSFTNHSYFTLNGGSDHCRDHVLALNASGYAQTCRETEPICTGEVLPVQDTPFDLRAGAVIGSVLARDDFAEIRTGGGIDHFFPVDGEGMRAHARLRSERDGLELICRSDAPGVLVYTANGLEQEPGKGGRVYGRNWAVCLETECFPNAVNQPRLRSQVLHKAGEAFHTCTEFVFECI